MRQCRTASSTVNIVSVICVKQKFVVMGSCLSREVSGSSSLKLRPGSAWLGLARLPAAQAGSTQSSSSHAGNFEASILPEILALVTSSSYCSDSSTLLPSDILPRRLDTRSTLSKISMALARFPLHSTPPKTLSPVFYELCLKMMRTELHCIVCR